MMKTDIKIIHRIVGFSVQFSTFSGGIHVEICGLLIANFYVISVYL